MVTIGQPDVEERGYRNPGRPDLGIEALTLADLRRRLPEDALRAPHRLDFHQITLITRGNGTTAIDFTDYACQPGTLIHVRPGQIQRLPRTVDGCAAEMDAQIVLFTTSFPRGPASVASVIADSFGETRWNLPVAGCREFRRDGRTERRIPPRR